MKITPARWLHGTLRLPGDKSISHRAAIIAALARGRCRINNFATSADCASTLDCLHDLGVQIERREEAVYIENTVHNERPHSLRRAPAHPLDCGNSGSTMRMLAGVLSGQNFVSTLTGDDSLRARPMKRIITPLEMMGARIASQEGRAPLRIEGRLPLTPIRYEMPIASAQVKSCLLLAGLYTSGRTEVIEKGVVTRDHTERMLRWFGVNVESKIERDDLLTSHAVALDGESSELSARDFVVPGDISSAAFFIAAAALLDGSDLRIGDVGLNPTRAQIIKTLQALGARVGVDEVAEQCNELVGEVEVRGTPGLKPDVIEGNRANVLRGSLIAPLIDELPVLAVVGTQVEGGLEIREAGELRLKESDRIHAMVENLRAMNAEVEEYPDGLLVAGRTRLRGARLQAYGDHRIAMACAVAALIAEGESEIVGADCVGVSFPEFFELLETVIER